MSIMGTRVVRTEDPRLLTVGGAYVDDIRVPELTGSGTGHVRAQPDRARADHRHRRLGGAGGTGRGRRADGRRLRRHSTAAAAGGRAQRDRPLAARRAVAGTAAGGGPGALRRRAGGHGDHRRRLRRRGRGRTGQRGLRAAARGPGPRCGAGRRVTAVPRRRVQRSPDRGLARRPGGVRRLRGRGRADHLQPAGRAGADGGPRRRGPVGRRQADRLGEHAERADLPVHPGRGARARPRTPSA